MGSADQGAAEAGQGPSRGGRAATGRRAARLGLVREMFMRDQMDPAQAYILAVFESEEKARARERDPRREEGLQAMQATMADILAGPPEFTDLIVADEWTI